MMIKKLVGVAVIVTAVGALAGCPSPKTITTLGVQTVEVTGISPSDAYPDIHDGTQVTVIDSKGVVIGDGILTEIASSRLDEEDFVFKVTVPAGLPRYGIQVGSTNRHGTVWFSEKEMREGPGLCIGDACNS